MDVEFDGRIIRWWIMRTWEEKLAQFDAIVDLVPDIERKGKTIPYTSVNGHMFSLLNKDGELGFRFSKEDGEKFKEKHQSTILKTHGAVMRVYILITEEILKDLDLAASFLKENYTYTKSLKLK